MHYDMPETKGTIFLKEVFTGINKTHKSISGIITRREGGLEVLANTGDVLFIPFPNMLGVQYETITSLKKIS